MKLINHSGNKNGITYKYDAYGKPLNVNNDSNAFSSEVINQFMYAGQRYDKHTKLQYLRARFFMPYLKRFATQDSISFLNKFNYANNNPTMLHDPSGHFAELINFIFNGAGLLLSLAALSVSFGCTSLFISAVSSNIFSVSNLMLSFTNNVMCQHFSGH